MLHAWIDETGDRGVKSSSSPFFGMAALVVPDTHRVGLANAIAAIKDELKIRQEHPLHWNRHAKTFPRRSLISRTLARVEGLRVNYVIFEKAAIPDQAALLDDRVMFYNYTAGIMLERVLLTAADFPMGDKQVRVQFGHVKGFDHETTLKYFWNKRREKSIVNWSLLEGEPTFVASRQNSGVQAADQYAGFLHAAICPDDFGGYEPSHLLGVGHQIRKNPATDKALGYGMKVMARPGFLQELPWWRAS